MSASLPEIPTVSEVTASDYYCLCQITAYTCAAQQFGLKPPNYKP